MIIKYFRIYKNIYLHSAFFYFFWGHMALLPSLLVRVIRNVFVFKFSDFTWKIIVLHFVMFWFLTYDADKCFEDIWVWAIPDFGWCVILPQSLLKCNDDKLVSSVIFYWAVRKHLATFLVTSSWSPLQCNHQTPPQHTVQLYVENILLVYQHKRVRMFIICYL